MNPPSTANDARHGVVDRRAGAASPVQRNREDDRGRDGEFSRRERHRQQDGGEQRTRLSAQRQNQLVIDHRGAIRDH